MEQKKKGFWDGALRYLKRVALIVLGIIAGVMVSFIFTRGLTIQSFSERMFWGGMAAMGVGAFGFLSLMNMNRTVLGLPTVVTKKEDARKLMDHNLELRDAIDKRYDFCIMFWLIGMACVGICALATVIGAWLGVK